MAGEADLQPEGGIKQEEGFCSSGPGLQQGQVLAVGFAPATSAFSPSAFQAAGYLPREYWEKLVAEAGFGPSLNLKDCSWSYMLLMRLGMYMLELLVKAVKVPRNTLNPRLEPKLIPVLYHIYSFRSSWQVSLVLGALGCAGHLCTTAGLWQSPFPSLLPFLLRDTWRGLWFCAGSQ